MHTSLSSLLVAVLFTGGLAAQRPAGPAQVGEKVPEFSFGAMLHGDGRIKLSEFRGQPILIDFWGTH